MFYEIKKAAEEKTKKAEFENRTLEIQQEELNSDRFKKIREFVKQYNMRKNCHLEEELFKIIGTYGLDDHLINQDYENRKKFKINQYNKLKQFMNLLNDEEINSNMYLKAVKQFMEISEIDCLNIITQLNKQIDDLEKTDRVQSLELNLNIPNERLELLPATIKEQVGIPYYKPEVYKTEYIDILDTQHIGIYYTYNSYVRKINKLAADVYHLQMWDLLSSQKVQIENYHFSILNNDYEHEFRMVFFAQNKKVNLGISNSEFFMRNFIEKLKNGELKIEKCSYDAEGEEMTQEFIIHQLENYQKLIDSRIIEESVKEEQGPVKKLIPNKK